MFLVVRTLVYASLFVGFLLIYLPGRMLARSGIRRPAVLGAWQIVGLIVGTIGVLLAVACVTSFLRFGRGTPAPFDAPRGLVLRGPYRFVRNPMYTGAELVLGGAALFYDSIDLLIYACAFIAFFHLFVVFYEVADPAPQLRVRVRGVLPQRAAMVARDSSLETADAYGYAARRYHTAVQEMKQAATCDERWTLAT